MLYGLNLFQLKDKTACILKSPTEKQIKTYFEYEKQVAGESEFLLKTPEEFLDCEMENEKKYINYISESPYGLMITAWIAGDLAGIAALDQISPLYKQSHRAYLSISVKKKYWALGMGTLLMTEIINAAEQMNFEQIELDVIADNHRAVGLYKKFGFKIWGTNENAVKQKDGTYMRVYSMVLELRH